MYYKTMIKLIAYWIFLLFVFLKFGFIPALVIFISISVVSIIWHIIKENRYLKEKEQ